MIMDIDLEKIILCNAFLVQQFGDSPFEIEVFDRTE